MFLISGLSGHTKPCWRLTKRERSSDSSRNTAGARRTTTRNAAGINCAKSHSHRICREAAIHPGSGLLPRVADCPRWTLEFGLFGHIAPKVRLRLEAWIAAQRLHRLAQVLSPWVQIKRRRLALKEATDVQVFSIWLPKWIRRLFCQASPTWIGHSLYSQPGRAA